jgi:integrase
MKSKPKCYTGEKALTKEEIKKLLAVVESSEDELILLVGIGLGVRRSDMARIMVRNIDFEHHKITYLEKKKNDNPHTAPLTATLEQKLKIYIKEHNLKLNDPLFSIKDRQICNRFYKMLDKAGLQRRGIHSLRGSCIKLCQFAGWSVEQTSHLVNDEIRTIQIHYLTPSQAEMNAVAIEKPII